MLGDKGIGKSTFLYHFGLWILKNKTGYPIWLSLEKLKNKSLTYYLIEDWLREAHSFFPHIVLSSEHLLNLFKQGNVWLLIDGLANNKRSIKLLDTLVKGWIAEANIFLGIKIMTEKTWNPEIPNQKVRLKSNPSKQGVTTGKIRKSAGRLLLLINFGPNENTYKQYEQLELFEEDESINDLLKNGNFGTPDDLRRILTFEKIKGNLTNIFYSMESSNTDFYAYQFKPVLKFLDSPVGRLLIADEVGLGKTIESMYIWKELQIREDARRLLIVCPAMLRDKWVNDLRNRFNLYAEIIDTKGILKKVQSFIQNGNPDSFIYVTSLEGIRVKNWDDEKKSNDARAKLARLLEENPVIDDRGIFDLVIIDEAHYLRNPETANNKLGTLLREVSRYLILLTATPIQIRSNNLYQLLKLISPEDFFDSLTFEKMLEDNKPIVDTLKLIWKTDPSTDPNIENIKELINQALQSNYFRESSRLKNLSQDLISTNTITSEQQVQFAQILESSSLFGQFMTRSRKREVLKAHRVKRNPQTLTVEFTEQEKKVYDYISYKIRLQAIGQSKFNVFRLMARQRQMASSMVAALEVWTKLDPEKNTRVIDDFLAIDDNEEELYETYGSLIDYAVNGYKGSLGESVNWEIPVNPIPSHEQGLHQFITHLRKHDTKYQELIKCLKQELAKNKKEKFVLFAFYRNTLTYLAERLQEDGIQICLILGGMDKEDKQDKLKSFQDNNQISVLLSSEVGSEGIDLQFCRFLINYDLPWNPMRVEQRIGRLDRLNQKSERISIINFSLKDTIEEYILERLYERIHIFEESIGDLEEILGEKTEELMLDLLNPKLNEDELKEEADRKIKAIAHQMEQERKLENEAMNLVAFSDYILSTVDKSRDNGRWLSPDELKAFVQDFFKLQYPGTAITPNRKIESLYEIKLSEDAKIDLKIFREKTRISTPTFLDRQPVNCFFDSKVAGTMGKANHELIDPTHPLIQWIRYKYAPQSSIEQSSLKLQPVSASTLNLKPIHLDIKTGTYIYAIQCWKFEGIRTETRLSYKAICLEDEQILSNELAENLINTAAIQGEYKPNVINLINIEQVIKVYEQCEESLSLDFANNELLFEAENTDKCNTQESSVKAYANRKRQEFEERIERFKREEKLLIISAEAGKIGKNTERLNLALKKIEEKRKITTSNPTLATGIIFVEN